MKKYCYHCWLHPITITNINTFTMFQHHQHVPPPPRLLQTGTFVECPSHRWWREWEKKSWELPRHKQRAREQSNQPRWWWWWWLWWWRWWLFLRADNLICNVCQLFGICIYADNLNSFTFNNRTGSSPNILDVKENNFTFIFTISQFSQLEAVQTSSHCHLPSMPGRSLPRSENNNSFPKI